jgi:hypothetical protein
MSRKLEKYLTSERDRLDMEKPDDDMIWQGISSRLSGSGRKEKRKILRPVFYRIIKIAAVAFIIFSLGYITNDIIKVRRNDVTTGPVLSSVDSELGRRESRYQELINLKTVEVNSFSTSRDSILTQLFSEIKKLDTIYAESVKDLKEIGPEDGIINTIFATYEQKIRLLELIIFETNKRDHNVNRTKIRKNEKVSL